MRRTLVARAWIRSARQLGQRRREAQRLLLLACLLGLPAAAWAQVEYRLQVDLARDWLLVRACGGEDGSLVLAGAAGAGAALVRVGRDDGGTVRRDGARIVAPDWPAGGCLDYAIDLQVAAAPGDQARGESSADGTWVLAPDAWLWRQRPATTARLRIDLPEGWQASVPWSPDGADARSWTLPAATGSAPARTAFGRMARDRVDLAGGRVEIAVLAPPESALATRLIAWQRSVARLPLHLFGRMPVPHTQVLVRPMAGGGDPVPWAQSRRGGGVALDFRVDPDASADALASDWTAAHEYGHLFHPWLGADGSWLAEGLASYLQNVLRARAGAIAPGQAWQGLHAGLARGRAAPSGPTLEQAARRLRQERNYMRVYWSGAAFWLEADIALRQASRGRLSLDAGLDHFARCCLPQSRTWTAAQFVAELDRGLGVSVLVPLFDRYRVATAFPDLDAAWSALGLDPVSGEPRAGSGPEAAILRTAITASPLLPATGTRRR